MIAIEEKILEIEKTVNNSNKLLQNTENQINKLLDKINAIKKPIDNLRLLFDNFYEYMYDNFNTNGEEFYSKYKDLQKIVSQTNRLISLYKKHNLYSGFKNSLKELHYAVGNIKEIMEDLHRKFSDDPEIVAWRNEINAILKQIA